MKTRKFTKIISVLLIVITIFQCSSQIAFAADRTQTVSEQEIVLTNEEQIVDTIIIGMGLVAGLLYLNKNVPTNVLVATFISMLEHGFEKGQGAGYILEIASSYIPREDWEDGIPHPVSVSEEKGKFSVYMDSRFLNKDFCLEYADEIIGTYSDGETFHGMDRERIAIEVYGHAFIHYAIYFIKATPFYLILKDTIDSFYESSDPIDVNYNESESRMKIFNLIWGKI